MKRKTLHKMICYYSNLGTFKIQLLFSLGLSNIIRQMYAIFRQDNIELVAIYYTVPIYFRGRVLLVTMMCNFDKMYQTS